MEEVIIQFTLSTKVNKFFFFTCICWTCQVNQNY